MPLYYPLSLFSPSYHSTPWKKRYQNSSNYSESTTHGFPKNIYLIWLIMHVTQGKFLKIFPGCPNSKFDFLKKITKQQRMTNMFILGEICTVGRVNLEQHMRSIKASQICYFKYLSSLKEIYCTEYTHTCPHYVCPFIRTIEKSFVPKILKKTFCSWLYYFQTKRLMTKNLGACMLY